MIKKTLYITEMANEKWERLCSLQPRRSKSEIFEILLLDEYDRKFGQEKKSIDELLAKLQHGANQSNKDLSIILDLLNSFFMHGVMSPISEFENHLTNPHPWIKSAEQHYFNNIYNKQIKKI